jgi:WD40 repeat protein
MRTKQAGLASLAVTLWLATHACLAPAAENPTILKSRNVLSAEYMEFSPDGKFLASCHFPDTTAVWSTEDGKLLWKRQIPRDVGEIDWGRQLAFSPDNKLLATFAGSQTSGGIDLLDVLTGQSHRSCKIRVDSGFPSPETLAFTPDGERIAFLTRRNTIRLWKSKGDEKPSELQQKTSTRLEHLALSPDGKTLVTVGMALNLPRPDGNTPPPRVIPGVGPVGPDGVRLPMPDPTGAPIDAKCVIDFWEPQQGKLRASIQSALASWFARPVFSPDSRWLVLATVDGIVVFDVAAAKERWRWKTKCHRQLEFLPDGKSLAMAMAGDGDEKVCVEIVQVETGQITKTVDATFSEAIPATGAATLSHDGRLLAIVVSPPAVKVWNTQTGRELVTLQNKSAPAESTCGRLIARHGTLVFSPDGKKLAAARWPEGPFEVSTSGGKTYVTPIAVAAGFIELWDIATAMAAPTTSNNEPKPPVRRSPVSEFRTWSSANGKYTVRAKLIAVDGDTVTLLRRDGKRIEVTRGQLSPGDRAFLEK